MGPGDYWQVGEHTVELMGAIVYRGMTVSIWSHRKRQRRPVGHLLESPAALDGTGRAARWRAWVSAALLTGLLAPAAIAQGHAEIRLAAPPAAPQEQRFPSGSVTLAGLLRLPSGPPPNPAVVLVPGSGATAKEDARLGAVAAAFVAAGFVVLTTDSRGTGGSQGELASTSLEVLADDVAAAVAMLRQRPEVRADAVGLWGVSQGASWVGPLAAERAGAAFLVAASGPLDSPEAYVHRQLAGPLRAKHGLDEATIDRARGVRSEVWSYLATGHGYESASAAVAALRQEPWFAAAGLPPSVRPDSKLSDFPAGMQTFLVQRSFDPLAAIGRLACPLLAVYGAQDTQLPVEEHAATLRAVASKGGKITVEVLPGRDHDLRPLAADPPREGADNQAWAMMASWAAAQVAAPHCG